MTERLRKCKEPVDNKFRVKFKLAGEKKEFNLQGREFKLQACLDVAEGSRRWVVWQDEE